MKSILEIIIKPQVSTVGAATVDIGSRDYKTAEFGARAAIITVENVGTDDHLQVLGDIPGCARLKDSGRILNIVDGGKKDFKERVQFYL